MLWRSFLEKCCRSVLVREVLETVSVVENCWENCWKEVLQKDAGRRVQDLGPSIYGFSQWLTG